MSDRHDDPPDELYEAPARQADVVELKLKRRTGSYLEACRERGIHNAALEEEDLVRRLNRSCDGFQAASLAERSTAAAEHFSEVELQKAQAVNRLKDILEAWGNGGCDARSFTLMMHCAFETDDPADKVQRILVIARGGRCERPEEADAEAGEESPEAHDRRAEKRRREAETHLDARRQRMARIALERAEGNDGDDDAQLS